MPPAIDGATRIACLMGDPIGHTLSPAMQNAAFRERGLNWCFVAFSVRRAGLADAIAGMRGLGIRGATVTAPNKRAVIALLDRLSPEVELLGAANTVHNDDGTLWGYNTDVPGFARSLREGAGLDFAPRTAVLLGAGGAAQAALRALADLESLERIAVLNRTVERAEAAIDKLQGAVTELPQLAAMPLERAALEREARASDLVVNVTSLGMAPLEGCSPTDGAEPFRPGQVAFDIVYNPRETRFLAQARAGGARPISGISMLAYQGAAAFGIWTGVEAPVDVMLHAMGA